MALTTIYCRGTLPNTHDKCGDLICTFDGTSYLFSRSGREPLEIESPARIVITCGRCGYRTRIGDSSTVKKELLFTRI